MVMIPTAIGDAGLFVQATASELSPRITVYQGQTADSLAVQIARDLLTPPTFDGAQLYLKSIDVSGGGAGQNYVATLVWQPNKVGALDTIDGRTIAIPIDGQTSEGLRSLIDDVQATVEALPRPYVLVANPLAGGGAGAHYVGLLVYSQPFDPNDGTPLQFPQSFTVRMQLSAGEATQGQLPVAGDGTQVNIQATHQNTGGTMVGVLRAFYAAGTLTVQALTPQNQNIETNDDSLVQVLVTNK